MSLHYYYTDTARALAREATSTAAANGSFAEKLGTDQKGDLWIKSFLTSTDINKRGWSVSADTIHENVKSIIGKPFVQISLTEPEKKFVQISPKTWDG